MEAYKPSHDFTNRVMSEVSAYVADRKKQSTRIEAILDLLVIRSSLLAVTTLWGVYHLVRIYMVFLSPVVCR